MENEKPIMIQRQQTIILEANEKHSNYLASATYETVLNTPVEINNGDTVTLSKAFVDTSKIDPDKVFLADDVPISWNNGLYLINQQIQTVIPSSRLSTRSAITDNKPIVFCQYHSEAESNMVLWTKITTRRADDLATTWGDVPLQFLVHDANGNPLKVTRQCPKFSSDAFGNPQKDWNINIIGREDFPPQVWDSDDNKWLQAGDGFTFFGQSEGYIYIPITSGSQEFESITNGLFTPVINSGNFIIPKGSYEPVHLAKLITDNFAKMNSTRLTIDPVAKNNLYPYRADPLVFDSTTITITIPATAFQQLPFPWALDCLVGWTANVTYIDTNIAGPTPAHITNTVGIVVASDPSDTANTFRVPFKFGTTPPEATNPVYPGGGGATVVLVPPEYYYDGGSAFLQYTENYILKGVDGKSMFAFVDCSEAHTNVYTYQLDNDYTWFGSNNVELVWDDDQKRFRFNYLHFPLTDATSAPAVINQVNWVNDGNAYAQSYSNGSTNITSAAYGGIFFTALEPFAPFWRDILGFNHTIIAQPNQDTTVRAYGDTGELGYPNAGGVLATPYLSVTVPSITLDYGVNITEQLIAMGDITGQPPDYTGWGQVIFSSTAHPADGGATITTGRVAVPIDNVRGITAGSGTAIGVQTSGYYIVDIDIGSTYNENIGSDKDQQSYSRNIRGVIDRYYSANSYTSSQGGDIQYIHYGNSMTISKIRVRFTNSDGSQIKNIGTDNTIFLKVSKTNQVNLAPDPIQPPPASQ